MGKQVETIMSPQELQRENKPGALEPKRPQASTTTEFEELSPNSDALTGTRQGEGKPPRPSKRLGKARQNCQTLCNKCMHPKPNVPFF